MKNIKIIFVLAVLAMPSLLSAQKFTFDFVSGYDDWIGDFADYPVNDSVFYELEFVRTTLPSPLNGNKYALKITGNNHSDDLFMFIKRKISGLLPGTTYFLQIDVNFASNAPTNAFGVGGPPGEAVMMKAGATLIEPAKINSNGFYLMNIDKSNQISPGVDMDTIGHVGVSDTTTVFTLIHRTNETHLFTITTDAHGEVWVCIGTDSGFEATTTIYYNQIDLTFTSTSGSGEFSPSKEMMVYPNPTNRSINISANTDYIGQHYWIFDQYGRHVSAGVIHSEISSVSLEPFPVGVYFLKIGGHKPLTYRVIKL
jgi:hypothetical protein